MLRRSSTRPWWEDDIVQRLLYTHPLTGEHAARSPISPSTAAAETGRARTQRRIDPPAPRDYLAHGGYPGPRQGANGQTSRSRSSPRSRSRGPARPRRSRLLHRPEVGDRPPEHPPGGNRLHHLQRRRRRPRGIHGPLGDGRQPPLVIEGMLIAAYARAARSRMAMSTSGRSIRWQCKIYRQPSARRRKSPAGRGHPGDRLLLPPAGTPGRRCLRVRRGDGSDRIHRGTTRRCLAASISARLRTAWLGPAHQPEQRGDVRERAAGSSTTVRGRFASMGTATSKGTKIFSLTGKVVNGGLIEVPMGADAA